MLQNLMQSICEARGIESVLDAPSGVEVSKRSKDGREYIFVLNHNAQDETVPLKAGRYIDVLTGNTAEQSCLVPARGVLILEICS